MKFYKRLVNRGSRLVDKRIYNPHCLYDEKNIQLSRKLDDLRIPVDIPELLALDLLPYGLHGKFGKLRYAEIRNFL